MVDAEEGVAVTAEGETGEDLEVDVDALEAAAAAVIAEAVAAAEIVAVGPPPTGPCHARGRDPRAPGKEEGAGRDRGLGQNKEPSFPSHLIRPSSPHTTQKTREDLQQATSLTNYTAHI